MRLGPSTSTSSTRPTRSGLRSWATRWTSSTSRSIRSRLTLLRHLVRHRGGLGALPRAVDEREGAVVADLLDDLERLLEVALGLAREADDDVGRQREVGDRVAQLVDERQVALAPVRAPHRLEDARRARLERQVRVLADRVALGHRRDHRRRKSFGCGLVKRMRSMPSTASHGAQQLAELGLEVREQVAAPRVDVLAEQRHSRSRPRRRGASPRRGSRRAGGSPRGRGPTGRCSTSTPSCSPSRSAPRPGSAARGARAARPANVRSSAMPKRPRATLAARAEPVAEVRDRAGAEGDVDERVELEDPLALRLGVAAADGDHRAGSRSLSARVAEVRGEPLVGLLADRAGVEDEHVGLVLRTASPSPRLLEHALDPLGVVSVHLAAEGGDVVALHGASLGALADAVLARGRGRAHGPQWRVLEQA